MADINEYNMYTVQYVTNDLARRGTVLAVAQYPHPRDRFLFIALIAEGTKYVVTHYNAESHGFFYGEYFLLSYDSPTPFNHEDMVPGSPQHELLSNALKCFADKVSHRTWV